MGKISQKTFFLAAPLISLTKNPKHQDNDDNDGDSDDDDDDDDDDQDWPSMERRIQPAASLPEPPTSDGGRFSSFAGVG